MKPFLKKTQNPDGNPIYGAIGTASTIGMHMVSGPIVGSGLGYLCDSYLFDSWPIGSIIGFFIGVAAGFRNVYLDSKKLQKQQSEMENNNEQSKKQD